MTVSTASLAARTRALLMTWMLVGWPPVIAAEADYVGTWQLARDRTRPELTDDYMDFDGHGQVALRDAKGVYARCSYAPQPAGVLLNCRVRGAEKPLYLRTADAGRSLVNPRGDVYRRAR